MCSRLRPVKHSVPFDGFSKHVLSITGYLVILASRPLLALCDVAPFPLGHDVALIFKPPKRGIYSTSGQTSHIHNVESVFISINDGLKNHSR
jgi:hypothetical protein